MIYTCDTKCCHFIFFGSAETRVCPDCGKQIEVFGKSKIDSRNALRSSAARLSSHRSIRPDKAIPHN